MHSTHRRTVLAALLIVTATAQPLASAVIETNSFCTLSEAIISANRDISRGGCFAGDPGLDTIVLNHDEVLTKPGQVSGLFGLPKVRTPIEIEGNGFRVERAPAQWNEFGIFEVGDRGILTLRNLTIANGRSDMYLGTGGGAIQSSGIVRLESVNVVNNGGVRGAIWNSSSYGTLLIDRSIITSGNHIENQGFLLLTNSTVSDNGDAVRGGGIENSGTAVIINSTIRNNIATSFFYVPQGGGISHRAGDGDEMLIVNSTISDNVSESSYGFGGAQEGGGLHIDGPVTILNSTIAGNFPDGFHLDLGAIVHLEGSILAYNDSDDCDSNGGILVDGGGNFSEDCDFLPDNPITGFEPELTDNGGPTETHVLYADSNAIGAAGNCANALDQRGHLRDGACDSGSFEFGAETPPPLEFAVSGTCPGEITTTVTDASPGESIRVLWAQARGATIVENGPCQGVAIDLEDTSRSFELEAGELGVAAMTFVVDDSFCNLKLQALSMTQCGKSEVASAAFRQ